MIIGGGPTGICTLLCVMLKNPKRIILCETDAEAVAYRKHYPQVLVVNPKETDVEEFVRKNSDHRGADRVFWKLQEVLRHLNWHGKSQDQMRL